MKRDWLKDIHERMADFEVVEPQGLWDGICEAEGAKDGIPAIGPHKSTNRKWMWGSVAACLLLGWWLYPVLNQKRGDIETHPIDLAAGVIATVNHISTDNLLPTDCPIAPACNDLSAARYSTILPRPDAVVPSVVPHPSENITQISEHGLNDAQEKADTLPSVITPAEKRPETKPIYQYLAQVNYNNDEELLLASDHREQRLSIAISSSGGMGANSRQMYQGGYVGASTMNDDTEWKDSPLLGIMDLNRGADTERKVSHKTPIRTGLSLIYQINERWSLESGVTYTRLSSDIHEGSIYNYIHEEQTLQYIGVPMGVSYRVYSWQHLDFYLSSDVLAEQCVSGRTKRSFILGDHTQEKETISCQSRPLQMSIGTKVGVQYNLTSVLSLYAEPGFRYYFDDQSSIETVFKKNPLDFNLYLGVRFSVGKK